MTTSIEFRTHNGAPHPDTESMRSGALALLILDCIGKHVDVFGDANPVTVFVADDGLTGMIHLAPNSVEQYAPITQVPVEMCEFRAKSLSTARRKAVEDYMRRYADKYRKEYNAKREGQK